MKRKILSLIICVMMFIPANITIVRADAISASEMYQKFQELKKKYPEGSTWTGSYKNLSWQCMGWAETVCDYLFNENPRNWDKKTNWDKVCVGDHVRINNDGHSIVITNIIGDTIYYADCNAGRTNQVHWDKTMSRSELASKGTWRKTQASNGIRSDITPSAAPVPNKPTIKASAKYAKESTSVTVSWDKDSNAVKYEYFLAEYPEGYAYTTNSGHGFTTNTSIKFNNLVSGNYSVFVHGISGDGERSDQSNWVTFKIYADDYIPTKTVVSNNHIYALYDYEMSWSFARDLCKELGGNLVTVTSAAENAVIEDLMQSGKKDAYWLGATDIDGNDKDFKWVTGETFSYGNWMSGEPNSAGTYGEKEHFIEVRKSYGNKWNDVNNISKKDKGFILEVDLSKVSPTAEGSFKGNKYLLFDKNTTWTEAQEICKQYGGHLATIESTNENTFIKNFLQGGKRGWYYLGGQKSNGDWKWLNGTAINTVTWDDSAPNWDGTNLMMYKSDGSCVGLCNSYYPENDIDKIGFVCEIEGEDEPVVTPKPTPDVPTQTDTTVTAASVTTSPGGTVNVKVDLSGNKGFANLGVQVGYDANVLTLVSAVNNPNVGAVYTPAQQITANPYNMGWDSTGNIAFNGTLATLTFKVKENAPEGKYPITVSYYAGKNGDYTDGTDVNYDENFNALNLNYVNGAVTVSSHTPGDINGDGKVNNQDGTFLLRHLAGWNVNVDDSALDVNGDGKINNQDGTIILRYLAGWQVNIH